MTIRTTRVGVQLAAAMGAVVALALGASMAQARGGMSPAQTTTLQHQVDSVLRHAAPGARQVSPNTVEWPRDGVTLTLAVPGRDRASASAIAVCPPGDACVWQDHGYAGRRAKFFKYGTYDLRRYGFPPFTPRGVSSYFNNQWGGAKLFMTTVDGTFRLAGRGNLYTINDFGLSVTLRP